MIQITELPGDGIGPEPAQSVYTVADAMPVDFRFKCIDRRSLCSASRR